MCLSLRGDLAAAKEGEFIPASHLPLTSPDRATAQACQEHGAQEVSWLWVMPGDVRPPQREVFHRASSISPALKSIQPRALVASGV